MNFQKSFLINIWKVENHFILIIHFYDALHLIPFVSIILYVSKEFDY